MEVNQKGFGVVEILIVIVVVGLLGVAGWMVYNRQKSKTSEASSTQASTIQDRTSSDEAKKTDPNEGYLVLKEWGLRFKVPGGLTDVQYTLHGDTAGFFAKPVNSDIQYVNDYDRYENGNFRYATGVLIRSKDSTKPFAAETTREGKKVGDYYYYTSWAFSNLATGAGCVGLYGSAPSTCQIENQAFQLVNQGDGALLNTIELAQ